MDDASWRRMIARLEEKTRQMPGKIFFSFPERQYPTGAAENACRLIWSDSDEFSLETGSVGGERQIVRMSQNDLAVGPPGAPTRFRSHAPCRSFVASFYPDRIRLAMYGYNSKLRRSVVHTVCDFPCILPPHGYTLFHLLRRFDPERETAAVHCCLQTLLELALACLRNTDTPEAGRTQYIWRQIDDYLRLHLDANLSRQEIARKFHRNASYLSSLCRRNTQTAFNAYVRHLRIERAELLLDGLLSLDEIAAQCGFRQTNYLIRVFRSIHGVTPGQYRARNGRRTAGND